MFAQLGSHFEVTIPKVIVLDGSEKKAPYFVSVSGDIAGYECVYVVPDETFKLFAKNKESQDALVSQEKTSWYVDEFNEKATGLIEAAGITAGHWSGTFYFNISLATEDILGDIILPELDTWENSKYPQTFKLSVGETNAFLISDSKYLSFDEISSDNSDVVEIINGKLIAKSVGKSGAIPCQ